MLTTAEMKYRVAKFFNEDVVITDFLDGSFYFSYFYKGIKFNSFYMIVERKRWMLYEAPAYEQSMRLRNGYITCTDKTNAILKSLNNET